jgi:riboflavin synthase alpha subunit
MFTGIVHEIGEVESVERTDAGARLRVRAGLAGMLEPGDSVSVAGVCLTVAERADRAFEADVMNQTLTVTTLGALGPADSVNLEPALRAGDPLGGHLVQGHVDCEGEVVGLREDGIARRVFVELPAEARRYVVDRGSIALDGVSLTVAGTDTGACEVSLIPETLERTTLRDAAEGSRLNVELDVVARYVERLMQGFGGKD